MNISLTTRQGVNYVVVTKTIPLYLKTFDFFDRHFNYQELTRNIIRGSRDKHERVLRIFEWTHKTIKPQPPELDVVDDHVWHIIIRGYGTKDQAADVFATICSYAGLQSFFSICSTNVPGLTAFAFVKLDGQWRILDPGNGIYVKNANGELATVQDILSGNFRLCSISGTLPEHYEENLRIFLASSKIDFTRSGIQSPLTRFFYEVKLWGKQK